jgi:hypothetical protein
MSEATFSMGATVIGLAYVLTYAWAQLETLSAIVSLWNKPRKGLSILLLLVWAGMNVFSFMIAHNIHFDVIREKKLILFENELLWAKAAAAAIIVVYWIWVIGSFYFAVVHSRKMREESADTPPAP